MLGRQFDKKIWLGSSAVIVIIALAWVMWATKPVVSPTVVNATNTNPNRSHYATLYDAAWRQDDGRDTTLVTATLFVSPTIAALGADSARSTSEEQIWSAMKSNDPKTVPIVLTLDSVSGSLPDDTIQKSLGLKADSGQTFTLKNWQPMITPTRIVNTSGNTSSQIGVVLFTTTHDIDWKTIGTVTLIMTGIGGEKERTFSWVEPKLLLDL